MSAEKLPTVSQPPQERQHETLWDTSDVAAYLGVGRVTVRRYVDRHGLPHIRLPRGLRFDPEVIRQWAKRRETTNTADSAA